MKTAIIVIVVAVLVVIGIYAFRNSNHKLASNAPGNVGNSLYSNNTFSDGQGSTASTDPNQSHGIMLQTVNMPKPGFIAIEQDNNGQPGNVIASSQLLQSGQQSNVAIPANLTPGTTYFITMYEDNGDGQFEPAQDTPAKDQNGNVVRQQFVAPQPGQQPSMAPGAGTTPPPAATSPAAPNQSATSTTGQ